MQSIFPSTLSRTAGGHGEPRAVAGPHELGGHQKDLVAQGREGGRLKLRRQTQPFEPVDQIVSQQQQMKISLVGQEMLGWNLAQVITAFEFANDPFHAGPAVVETPQVQWLQRKIGDKDLIKILAQLEESQLVARLFGLGSSHYYIAVTLFQSEWLVKELGSRNVPAMMVVAQAGEPLLDGLSQFGGDHKVSFSLLQPGDGLVVVETLVRPDDNLSEASGPLGKTSCQQRTNSGAGISMTWTQFPVPKVFRLPFETKQRMVRPASGLERMVTNIGGFLSPVNDQRCGVQIENQAPGPARPDTHLDQKAIVEPTQPRQGLGCDAQQKSSQRSGIRIVRQTTQVLKHSIGLQQVRGLDPFETENQRINDRQQQFAHGVAVVALGQPNIFRDCFLETNLSQKPVQQIDATVMRQALIAKRDAQFSGTFWHANESYLRGSFHSQTQKSTLARQYAR